MAARLNNVHVSALRKNVKEVLEGITIRGILVSFLWADLDLKNIGREFYRYCKGLFVRKVSLVCESLNHSTDKPEFGDTVSSVNYDLIEKAK